MFLASIITSVLPNCLGFKSKHRFGSQVLVVRNHKLHNKTFCFSLFFFFLFQSKFSIFLFQIEFCFYFSSGLPFIFKNKIIRVPFWKATIESTLSLLAQLSPLQYFTEHFFLSTTTCWFR